MSFARRRSERRRREPERSEGSSRARSAATRSLPCHLGAPAGYFDGLGSFDDFGMSGSDLRNRCSRCVSECRGGKLTSPSRARAKQCGGLARGTSARVRSVPAGSLLYPVEERSDEVVSPDPAPNTIRQSEWWEGTKNFR